MIRYENQQGIGILTLDNPESLNSLSSGILEELHERILTIKADRALRVLLITGVSKAFVAGANIKEMSTQTEDEALAFARRGLAVFLEIQKLTVPVIAVVNGFALGGGMELALACDLRFASEKAKLGQPEVGLGIIPGFGGTQRLARLVGPSVAKDLIFSGRMITAEEAKTLGLVDRVFSPEELMQGSLEYAKSLLKNSPQAIGLAKRSIDEGLGEIPFEIEARNFSKCFSHPDQKEGMQAFLEKRSPEFKEER